MKFNRVYSYMPEMTTSPKKTDTLRNSLTGIMNKLRIRSPKKPAR